MPRKATLDVLDSASSPASKINLVIGIVVGLLVIASALINYGKQSAFVDQVNQRLDAKATELSAKVESASRDATGKVDLLASEVKGANTAIGLKQDALSDALKTNQAEQLTFRSNVQTWLTKLSSDQQSLKDQITKETMDRLTDVGKRK